jgi:hypothetical protein
MSSLPFISHHLFVAAIGNDDRATSRPTRHEGPSVGTAEPANDIALELMDEPKPSLGGANRPVRATLAQARS